MYAAGQLASCSKCLLLASLTVLQNDNLDLINHRNCYLTDIALFCLAEEPKASPAKPPQADETPQDETSQDKPVENQEQPPPDTTDAETGGQEGEEPPEDESQMVVEDAVEEKQEEGKEGEGEPTEQDEKPGIVAVHIKLCFKRFAI